LFYLDVMIAGYMLVGCAAWLSICMLYIFVCDDNV